MIQTSTLQFLTDLSENNNKIWFDQHKEIYKVAQENVASFADEIIAEMNRHDVIENESGKKSLYRIYNDVRFSKDKSPYNIRFAFSLKRATKYRRGGYYFHLQPGNTFLACGFFSPNPEDLLRIRQDIAYNYAEWYAILYSENIKSNFGILQGNTVSTAPRGFDKNHEAIALLRHKQFILRHDFTDQEVLSEEFVTQVNEIYKSVRPFFDYMSEILTTNANGEELD